MAVGRRERRMACGVGARLEALVEPFIDDTAWIENASRRGARVISTRRWTADAPVVLKSFDGMFDWASRIVYCERLADGRFAVGLEFEPADDG